MNEFIRSGSKIYTRPNGVDYTLENGITYTLKYDDWEGTMYLELSNNLTLPSNYFYGAEDKKFVDKVLKYFEQTAKNTTGVMLKGLKGSGKSITAKKIALESNLPIIVVDTRFPAKRLNEFFNKFQQNVIVLFDELEKNERYWNDIAQNREKYRLPQRQHKNSRERNSSTQFDKRQHRTDDYQRLRR